MDVMKLRYFTTAAECGSFSETARRLYTSQPNISKQISSMEAELGTKLFLRDSHKIRLTRAGQYLYEQLKDFPALFDRVFDTTRALGRGDVGELTIGVLSGQRLDRNIIDRFRRFTQLYPELSFTLERAGFSELQEALRSLRFDMILTFSFDIEPSPELVIRSVEERQGPALFASRFMPDEYLRDLSRAPFVVISPKESYGGYQQLVNSCRRMGFEPNIVRLADSLDSLLFYVETGVGVAILDRNTRLETDQNIRVIPLEDADLPGLIAVWLVDNANPNIRRLADCLCTDPPTA